MRHKTALVIFIFIFYSGLLTTLLLLHHLSSKTVWWFMSPKSGWSAACSSLNRRTVKDQYIGTALSQEGHCWAIGLNKVD